MRQPLSLFLFSLFCALVFVAGCNPPTDPECSPYIGQATINEVSKVQHNSDSANDFVEIKIMTASLSAATLNNWTILVCERGTSTCGGAQLSSATVTGSGANRYYVLKSLSNIGRHMSFANSANMGTEIALADQNDQVIDYLSTAENTANQPSCTFPNDTDADTTSSTRRMRRLPDGTGVWDVVNGNSQPPTEGANNGGSAPAHVAITHAGTASTCRATNVTVSLHSGSHVATSGVSGSINLATSTGRGLWTRVTGSGVFTETGTSDDGGASYTFSSGESSAVFSLHHGQPGIVNINISGAMSEDSTEDSALIFSNAAFLIRTSTGASIPTQISAKNSNEGWNSSVVQIEAIATNPDNGACTGVLTGSQAVKFGYECVAPSTCSGSNMLTINGAEVTRNITAGSTAGADVTLTFNNSIADIPLNYRDAGRITLHAHKTLTDGSGVVLNGSASFVVRPFGFGFPSIVSGSTYSSTAPANPAGTASSGDGFVAAGTGSPFSATVAAYRFASGEDADSDGIPDLNAVITDNGITPNFAFSNVTVSAPEELMTPLLTSGGIAGTLGGAAPVSVVAGTATLNNLIYNEVGSLRLRARALDYLGAGANIQGYSPNIGRFYPQKFTLVSLLTLPVTPLITPACAPETATPFTYMGQGFGITYQLEARNTNDDITHNYDTNAGYTAGSSAATVAYVAENANSGTPLSSRVMVPPGFWDNGIYVYAVDASNFTVTDAVFARSASEPRGDGPFSSLQLGIVVTDADGPVIESLDMNAITSDNCSVTPCTAKAIGNTTNMRYGRLALRNTTGSDQATAITIPALVEYYSGNQFVRNEDDSCTRYGYTQIQDVDYFNPGTGTVANSYTDARGLTAGRWSLPSSDLTMSSGQFRNFPNSLVITPVAGVTGELGITLSAAPILPATPSIPGWLLYDWDNNAATNETGPSCTLTLGQARGHDRVIFWREMH